MKNASTPTKPRVKDGDLCNVVFGTHTGKSGTVTEIKKSTTGHVIVTVIQESGIRFKTHRRNLAVRESRQVS